MQDESDKKEIVCTCYVTGHGKEGVAVWDPYAEFESTTLPNGLTVHAAHWPGRSWEAVGFLIHSGAAQDPPGYEGVAHFVEHVVSANTAMPTLEIENFFKENGGRVALGETSHAYTRYAFFASAEKDILATAFSIFGNMLLCAHLEKEIERERQVILREFHRRYPTKLQFDLHVLEHAIVHKAHWLEQVVDILGTPGSISQITQDELQAYYDAHYTPANISIVAVGGMPPSEIARLLERSSFSVQKNGTRRALPKPLKALVAPLENIRTFRISEHIQTKEVLEVGAYKSIGKVPGSISQRVVNLVRAMLEEVLFEEVRERRTWTYSIKTSQHNFQEFHTCTINCGSITLHALDDIETVVRECIVLAQDDIDLFEKMKRQGIASYKMIDVSGVTVCDEALMDLAYQGRIISLREIDEDFQRITMDDVRDCFTWLAPERRSTLIVRP